MMTMSSLYVQHTQNALEQGNLEGYCSCCNIFSQSNLKFSPGEKYTLFEYMQDISLICPNCLTMLSNQQLRYQNWIITPTEFRILKNNEVLETLIKETNLFYLFSTRSHQRTGYLRLFRNLGIQSGTFKTWVFETELLHCEQEKLVFYRNWIQNWLQQGFCKKELETGQFHFSNLEKNQINRFQLQEWQKYHKDPIFQFVLFFSYIL
jgi:hypothetical protein